MIIGLFTITLLFLFTVHAQGEIDDNSVHLQLQELRLGQ